MIFFGTFFGADEMSIPIPPTDVNGLSIVTVENTKLDTLYATANVEAEITKDIPTEWDFDTIMNATFDTSTAATNVEWTLETVSHLVIKRKLEDEFEWTTIYVKEINTLEDFVINESDITPTTGSYLYAVVPVLNGVEGYYSATYVDVEVTKLSLSDDTGTFATLFTDGSCDTTNETPIAFQNVMYNKYPTAITNTITNYQRITVTGEFYPTDDDGCSFNSMLDDSIRTKYIKELIDFLTNRKAKILKNVDGRRWLVMIDNGVADNMSELYKMREISFTAVEIGDPDSSEDLVRAGLSNLPEEWW